MGDDDGGDTFTPDEYTAYKKKVLPMVRLYEYIIYALGAIQVLRNADGGGGCPVFWKKALRRCNVQCY